MKKITALALLAVSGGAFAFDQYLPVAKNKLEADAEFSYSALTGYDDGGSRSSHGSPSLMTPAIQLKYGIIDGLDAEVYAEYDIANKDAGDVSGINRPQVAIKYAHPELGVGAFVNVAIPVGSKDIVGDSPATQIQGGVIYGKTFGQIVANAFADYQYSTEDDNKTKQDAIEVYAQGQFNVTPIVGPYLGVDFVKTFEHKYDGEGADDAGYLLTLKPGSNFTINDKFAAELTVPVSIIGKNAAPATSWGVYVGAYYTFAL